MSQQKPWLIRTNPQNCMEDFNRLTTQKDSTALVVLPAAISPQGRAYLASLSVEDWHEHFDKTHDVIERKIGHLYTLKHKTKGWKSEDYCMEEACETLTQKMESFFPKQAGNGRGLLLVHLSHLAARFAEIAQTNTLQINLSAYFGGGNPSDFSVTKTPYQASLTLLGSGRLFVDPTANTQEMRNKVNQRGTPAAEIRGALKRQSVRIPKGALAIYGKDSISAAPRLSHDGIRVCFSMKPF